jgi:hypothetical protein
MSNNLHPNLSEGNEAQLKRLVADAFREKGWDLLEGARGEDVRPDFVASGHGKKLVIEIQRASEGRKDRVIPLLSQAALNAIYQSRRSPGHPIPVAIVGANRIPESVAREAMDFMRERAPEAAIGLLDFEGFRSFAGHGLESLNSPRQYESSVLAPKGRAPQLFSDLNQWMLKVLLAPRIPEEYLSAPRGEYRGAALLAKAAGVSVMSAFRFVEELSKEGFLDSGAGPLRLVRVRELMNRWASASQRRILEVPMRWVLHRGKDALANALRSYEPNRLAEPNFGDQQWKRLPRLCIGLFEAAEELGVGFVHGVKPSFYQERLNAEVLKDLGLSRNVEDAEADVHVRIPGNRECIFRGVIRKDGLSVSDIIQVWLDVSQNPSRGKEQADLIWRRVLSPALESIEP